MLVILTGPAGVGKTHTMKAVYEWMRNLPWTMLKEHWKITPTAKWKEFSRHMEDDRFQRDASMSHMAMFIDDVGTETDRFKTGEGIEELRLLLDERQKRGWTMMSTNVPPAEWARRWDDRVADRLFRGWTIIDLWNTPSWNLQ